MTLPENRRQESTVYLTPLDAAKVVGYTRSDIYNALNSGELRGFRSGYGPWRILKKDLKKWIGERSRNQRKSLSLYRAIFGVKAPSEEEVLEAVDRLYERERLVITKRFGLEDGRSKTLEELGAMLNITRERVRQIQLYALRHLREDLLDNGRLADEIRRDVTREIEKKFLDSPEWKFVGEDYYDWLYRR
jgi:excisionase family DNA binding protein